MPLTQARMIRLINAGSKLLQNYEDLKARALDHEKQVIQDQASGNTIDWLSEFRGLVYLVEELRPDIETVKAISEEKAHFRLNRRHNDRTREQMARLRRRRAREANPGLDDDFYENQEPPEPIELSTPERPVDLDYFQQQLYDEWQQRKSYPSEHRKHSLTLGVGIIIDILKDAYRIKSEARQAQIIEQMVAEGRIFRQEIKSEYLVADPQSGAPLADVPADPSIGGLLPTRMIGLKKRAE